LKWLSRKKKTSRIRALYRPAVAMKNPLGYITKHIMGIKKGFIIRPNLDMSGKIGDIKT